MLQHEQCRLLLDVVVVSSDTVGPGRGEWRMRGRLTAVLGDHGPGSIQTRGPIPAAPARRWRDPHRSVRGSEDAVAYPAAGQAPLRPPVRCLQRTPGLIP